MVKKLTMVMISAALLLGLSSCAGITRSMLYFPGNDTRVPDLTGSRLLEIESGRNVSRGVFVPGDENLVVLFHGNGGTFYAQQEPARRWREAGFSVFDCGISGIWHQRGFPPLRDGHIPRCGSHDPSRHGAAGIRLRTNRPKRSFPWDRRRG